MLKLFVSQVVTEVLSVAKDPVKRRAVEKTLEKALDFAIDELPPGKLEDAAKAALKILQEAEAVDSVLSPAQS